MVASISRIKFTHKLITNIRVISMYGSVGNPEKKDHFEELGRRWEDNVRTS
jgi:hypothetical protein